MRVFNDTFVSDMGEKKFYLYVSLAILGSIIFFLFNVRYMSLSKHCPSRPNQQTKKYPGKKKNIMTFKEEKANE